MAADKRSAFCHACGEKYVILERVGREEVCQKCGADLHCCRNCLFYDPSAYNECREPMAERVVDKEESNFCDFFKPSGEARGGVVKGEDKASEAKRRLEELFKKGTRSG